MECQSSFLPNVFLLIVMTRKNEFYRVQCSRDRIGKDNQLSEVPVDNSGDHQIVPGISVTSNGQATVDPSLSDLLLDLAIKLEEPTNLPVDVEHVLAAVVLAARTGELDPETPLSSDDPALVEVLVVHVKTVFERFGGKVGRDD